MRFNPTDGSKPTQSTVQTGTLAASPEKNPQRESFRFDGWTYDGQPFNFQTPILQDTTLKAQWTKITDWTLSPDHGLASGARLTINPPNQQEPCYVSVQAAGDQVVSLTGDGRIYTWTKDSTPVQLSFPAQASDGFHYLQAAAGSRWQAALGSDQRIYTWDSGQSTPAILDTGKDAGFTSISMNGDRLLAVNRQGQVHAYRASDADSQGLNPKFLEQAAISLPGRAQAVTAVASDSRILALDSDGQAWTWDANNTGNIKPARIKQDPGTRIIQAQALSQELLLLDTDGHTYYQADGKSSITAVSLPEGMKASRITANKDQAMIVGKDGHVWAWKLGETPKRADDGSQQYVQAASTGGGIAAISRQGNMFTWSLDGQSQPGKPDRLDTTQAPTLESASLDGQPLSLTAKNDVWRADMPARKPGQAAILITGRQDGQPFARSLAYTVDQPLARAAEPGSAFTVRFDTGGGSPKPADQTVPAPYGRVKRPSPDPTREGYLFDGWFTGQVAYDFSRPVDKDLTLTAHWTPASRNNTWSISPNKGSQLGREPATITPPDSASRDIRFNQVSASTYDGTTPYGFSLAVGSDGNAYAWGYNGYGQLGDGTRDDKHAPVIVRKPDRKTYPDLPVDFTYVQVSAGGEHSLALGSDGYVYAWGNNSYGQLGNNSTSYSYVPVRVRDPANPTDTSKGLKAAQVSAGYWHSLAMGSDGNAYAWGYNDNSQLGDGTRSRRTTPIMVRTPDRKTYPDLPADFSYVQVSAGSWHSLALGSNGDVYAWGWNKFGQLGNNNYSDDFSGNPVPVRVRDPANPTDTSKGLKAVQVSAGYSHSLAVGSDGYGYAWGDNSNGQLGNNTTNNLSVPVHVRDPASPTDASKGLKATQVSGGYYHSLAVGSDGNAYAWGDNNYGQLGNNSYRDSTVPVPVSFNLQLMITGVKFDTSPGTNLTRGDGSSVTVTTPAHAPGTVTVSVDYTLGGAPQTPDTSLRYTYLPAGVLPKAGGEGILLALAAGMTGMGGVLASRRHRKEQHQLLHASHE